MMNEIYFDIPQKQVNNLPKKQVLIIIKSSENTPGNIDLLKNIIKALKIDFDTQVHVIEMDENDMILKSIPDTFQQILLFGIEYSKLGFHLDSIHYKINQLVNFRVILSHGLNELTADQNKKGQLWKALQLMFGLILK